MTKIFDLSNFIFYRRMWMSLLAIVIAVSVWYFNFGREDQIQLTVEERQWLKDHPTITVSPNPIFPPYEFYDDDGEYSGLSADLFHVIGKKLGISIKTIRNDGRDARWQALLDGRIDVLGSVKKTPLRQKDFLFSQPIAYSRDVIIVRSSITHAMTIDSLIGMRVAIPKNNAVHEEIRINYPGITIVPAGAGYASMYAVSFGTADATILNMGAASYYIEKTGLNNLRVAGNYNERSELSFGFSRNQLVLKSIIDKALNSIPLDQREQMNKKWLGLQVQTYWWSFISWNLIVGILSAVFLAVLAIVFWNRSLQRQVNVKTSTLSLEITERKIAEKKFKEIITKNPMSIQILDKDGYTLEVNNSFTQLFGSAPPPGYSIFSDKQFAQQGLNEIFDKLRTGRIVRFPDVCFNPKDSIPGLMDVSVWTRTIGFPLNDSNDKPEQFVLMHENITEHKRAEEALRESEDKYRSLFNANSDGIFIFYINEDNTISPIAIANNSAAKMLGYDLTEFIGRHPSEFEHSNTEEKIKERMDVLKTSGSKNFETELLHKNGNIIQVEMSAHVINYYNRPAIMNIVRDNTERKTLQTQLLQSQKLESIGTLASGIAHDFNNILNIIVGNSDLLNKSSLDEKNVRRINAIASSATRGMHLVKQLLMFARKTKENYIPLFINDVVEDIAKLISETFPKTIIVSLELEKNLPKITADPNHMHQVLMNLSVNARDAMPSGGTLRYCASLQSGEILRKRFPEASTDRYVVLTVKDTGMGMDEETLRKIFDPFYTTKEVGKGTGLGMSVVQGIIKSHNGFIDVRSKVNIGTEIEIYLPVLDSEETTVISEIFENTLNLSGNETILLIEDEEFTRDVIEDLLHFNGYQVIHARDGEEGVELYKNKKDQINIVVSDFGLPKFNGEEVFRRIKGINPEVRFILISGFLEPGISNRLTTLGVNTIVAKPFKPDGLLSKIRETLDNRMKQT